MTNTDPTPEAVDLEDEAEVIERVRRNVRGALAYAGLTFLALSALTGVPRYRLSNRNTTGEYTLTELIRIARACDVTLESLVA